MRRNEQIRARELRVIGPEGEQLGILGRNEAIAMAKEHGLDLVEVAATADPPVCRVMDYGKFKYETQKKKQEAKKRQTVVQIKEIKVRPKTDDHDFDTKVRHIKRFLEDGDRVKVTVFFRGREIVHKDRGLSILERVIADTKDVGKVERGRPYPSDAADASGQEGRRPGSSGSGRLADFFAVTPLRALANGVQIGHHAPSRLRTWRRGVPCPIGFPVRLILKSGVDHA